MILKNGFVMCDDFSLRKIDVKIEKEKIVELGNNLQGENERDFTDNFILPGFIDTHIHGSFGTRTSDLNSDFKELSLFLAGCGITSFAPTTASSPVDNLVMQIENIVKCSDSVKGAKIYGIHLEGPFLNKQYKGAMNEDCIASPCIDNMEKLLKAGNRLVKIVTLAPEVPGGKELLDYLVGKGIIISIGHTNATFDEAIKAFDSGVKQATHTFNAMRPYNHREPGVLGAVLTDDRVKCEIICDYIHIHEKTVELIYKLKGADLINIVSDSEKMTGLDIDEFESDGYIHYVKDGVIRLKDGTIAGSAKTMADGVKNLLLSGIPMEDVSKTASKNPAETLSAFNETGSISVGKYADITVLDKGYNVATTFVNGEEYKNILDY